MLLDFAQPCPDLAWLLPGALLVKDAHRYPITLERVAVAMETPEGRQALHSGQ